MSKYLLIMREKFKILQEDDVKIYNKWVKGIAKSEGPSEVITVDDILNRYRNSVSYKAPKKLPYGMDFLLDKLGDMVAKSTIIRGDLAIAIRNPVISEHSNRIKAVRKINDKLEEIQKILFSCTEEMNKIVENEEK